MNKDVVEQIQVSQIISEINDIFGWENEGILHALLHLRNAVYNLRADLAVEKALRESAEEKLKLLSNLSNGVSLNEH
jgi:hypothetical protein